MTTPTVRIATTSDQDSVTSVVVLAFSADPGARWTWPNAQEYLTHFPNFVKAFGCRAFTHRSAYYVEGYGGAALWLPPDVHPDEDALNALLQSTAPAQIRMDLFEMFEQMGRFHPSEPHWYLPLIGVDPARQGKGFGSALMQQALIRCDRESKPAYLESSNPKNIPLYERHGFELLGKIQVGASPTLFPMLRKPR